MNQLRSTLGNNTVGNSPVNVRTETGDAAASNATTAVMRVGDQFTGTLQSVGDVDWIKIDLVAGKTYRFTLDGFGQNGVADTVLTIYSPSSTNPSASRRQIVAQNDDAPNGPYGSGSLLTFTPTMSGTYFVNAAAWNNKVAGGYVVEVQDITTPTAGTVWTLAQIAHQLTDGYWDQSGDTIRAFDLSASREISVNFDQLGDNQSYIGYAQRALRLWSDVTGITFTSTSDSAAGIYFTSNESGAWSDSDVVRVGQRATITQSHVNVELNWSDPDYTLQTFIHEVGHALGLGHAGNYNGSARYGRDNLYINDSWQATVMSYFSQSENTYIAPQASYADLITPMLADIIAIRVLYSSSFTTRTGDDVYGFHATAGEGFDDAALNGQGGKNAYALTIIDDGGLDTIDLSGSTYNNLINLNPLAASNTGGLKGNLCIAPDTIIENAIGGSGDDTLIGNSAANTLTDSLGKNSLSGGAGNDTLLGGDGADTLNGGADDDLLNGGGASDTVSYIDAGGGVTIDLNQSTQNTGGAGIDTLFDIENIIGSGFDDYVIGNSGLNALGGGAGNDTLMGGGGDDTLIGGDGTDYAFYDVFLADITVIYNIVSDTFTVISANSGTDLLSFIEYLRLIDVLDFSLAPLRVQTLTLGDDLWTGGVGNDEVAGLDGNDSLNGGAGADTINGGAGNDSLNGGTGTDTASYETANTAVTVNLRLTTTQPTGGAGNDILIGFENLIGSDFADVLTGNSAANNIQGGTGNDTITGGGGNDTLSGGAGNDLFILSAVGDLGPTAQISGDEGNDTLGLITTVASTLILTSAVSVERVEIGTGTTAINVNGAALQQAITLVGNAGINTLTGGAGADSLEGGAGNDILTGGLGSDTLIGGSGNDVLAGGADIDTASYLGGAAVSVNLSLTTAQTTLGAGTDTLTDIENLIGSAGNDTLTGSALANLIEGGAGNDVINGGAGADTLIGGDGMDLFIVSFASDMLAGEQIFGASDELRFVTKTASTLTLTSGVNVAHVVVGTGTAVAAVTTATTAINVDGTAVATNQWISGNAGANRITGGIGADLLEGANGADTLIGGDGADTLNGGAGLDRLTGGAGADVFVFNTALATSNKDTITDFNVADDTIYLAKSVMSVLVAGQLAENAFWSSTAGTSHTATDRIIYNQNTGALFYDADGNGSKAAVQIVQISMGLDLSYQDFWVTLV